MKKLLFILLTLSLNSFGQTAEEYYNKGISKFNIKDYTGAIADYNKAIQLKPDYANYFYGRGNAKERLADYSGALKDFDKAIQLKPDNNALSYNKRGLAKIYYPEYRFDEPWSKDLPTAIDDINKAIQQSPDFSDAYFNRGLAKNFKHMDGDCADWSKAEELGHAEAWTWIQNYCKKTAEEYYNKGISKFNIKDYTGAIAAYNKAIQLKPDYADAYYYRGTAKYYLQDYTGAMIDYNQAIQLKPDNANAYSARGTVKYYLQDMNGACADWSKAVELGYAQASTYIQNYCKQIVEAAEAEAQAQAAREAAEESALNIRKQDVRIGNQVWTRTNLNVTTYRNGDKIPQVQDAKAWANLKTGAWCYYENKTENGTTYGKLYNFYAVNDSRGLAPKGYHIPTDAEWTILTDYLGGGRNSYAGPRKMKSNTGWKSHLNRSNGNGDNTSGFNALPGGCRFNNGGFGRVGQSGFWWSSSEDDTNINYFRSIELHQNYENIVIYGINVKRDGFSVRCLRD
jgi:uncharacterized protein (TIGR02145 family)